ncbi:MAG: U32 family peptidase [Kiritimatiellae bacterium]|nr:U32 family peptidase [Kiritimatiellia bacterium]
MSAELLSPAGDFDSALAAFRAGADAVYCSLAEFSARAFAKNFSREELKNLVRYARAEGKKVYVAFNTVIDEGDLERAVEQLSVIASCRPSAVIVQDLGIARIARKHFPSLELHASTQLVAHNLEGVLALGELGFKRVVLARELSIAEISSIAKRCGDIELECFIHGALCYSISGLCLFSAMEKNRSGNRGKCAYCCRLAYESEEGGKPLAFSMKDFRLGDDVKKLVDASVASLKIEGRMKSPLYVAAATSYYRAVLDSERIKARAALENLETVFSRRTTDLYFNGPNSNVIDDTSLGHLGTYVGKLKRITKDRDGRSWLRFHTLRALERHDGLQIPAPGGGKPLGFGITEMRTAISRSNQFEVPADCDVEILLPDDEREEFKPLRFVKAGASIYCSMSNEVKRLHPIPGFRSADYPGFVKTDFKIEISSNEILAIAEAEGVSASVKIKGDFSKAKNPERTYEAVEKAFSKLGGTDYRLGLLSVLDPDRLFAPMSFLNDLRRDIVEELDYVREKARRVTVDKALEDDQEAAAQSVNAHLSKTLKIRMGQKIPAGNWDEVIVSVSAAVTPDELRMAYPELSSLRISLPVFTSETEYQKLRVAVKRFVREGFYKWEATDLATLKTLKSLGVVDITADWTLYAFNSFALAELKSLGVTRFVASPENGSENLMYLAESGYPIEFLAQQSTPLFISLTPPAALPSKESGFVSFKSDSLWITTRRLPRVFNPPRGTITRIDLSWSKE